MSHLKKYLITLEVGGILAVCNTRSYVEGIDKLQPSRFLSDFIARKLAIYIQSDLGKLNTHENILAEIKRPNGVVDFL